MYQRQFDKTPEIDSDSSGGDSSSSSDVSAKICRICHVVENCKSRPKIKLKYTKESERGPQISLKRVLNFFLSPSSASETDTDEEFIAPCECRGTMRHVHRGCLNQWRTASPRSDSFTRCEQCFAPYSFKHTRITSLLIHPATIHVICTVLFLAWLAASTLVSTGALSNYDTGPLNSSFPPPAHNLFNLLPIISFDSVNNSTLSKLISVYNNFLQSSNQIFYGLIFLALTEYIFFTPSFILSFNTLFCIWRIQRYEIFFDKWLLVGFTLFGGWRAGRSLHGMINAATSRIVKLKLLEILDRDELENGR